MKTFYHSSDMDGVCSAAILHQKYPQAELFGINYGDEFPWNKIEENETIYMVDFSLQPFTDMIRLNELADLRWIDHHISAIKEAEKSECEITGLRRVGLGACALVWEYLYPDQKMPRAVELMASYDVWIHDDPDTLPFQYGAQTFDFASDPSETLWDYLLRDDQDFVSDVICRGKSILDYIDKDNARKAATLCFDHKIDGLKVIAANFGPSNSKLFDSVWDSEVYDAMMLFYFKGTHWTVSLYSDREDVDVSKVCKARGGGGHKGAAGFQIKSLKEIGLGDFE